MTIDQNDRTNANATVALPADELAQLLTATVSVAHETTRFTAAELHAVYDAWNQLLGRAPELYATVPEICWFHQSVLSELEDRGWQDDADHSEELGWAE
jgi:hypothetical protein